MNVFFYKKICNNFLLSEGTAFKLPASYFSSWDTSNELSFDLKRSFWKFDVRLSSWPDPKKPCCISVDLYGRREHIYGVFIALAGFYQKVLSKNWWPFMTWNDLADMARGHWLQYSDSVRQVQGQSAYTRCLRGFQMVFFQKRRLWFSPIDFDGEVAKLTWPWIIDIKIPRYKFYQNWYGYQSLKVSRWSGIRCSYDEHSNFSELRSLDVTWSDLTLNAWVWNFHNMCGKDVWTGVQKTVAIHTPVFEISAKNLRGECSNTLPGPAASFRSLELPSASLRHLRSSDVTRRRWQLVRLG